MALSYLLGSEGHYGQPRVTGAFSSSSDNSNSNTENQPSKYHSATLLADYEAHSIIELLAHCIHNRAKEGPGGYSAATFTVKGVLHSIRCLMTNPKNRIVFASIDGARLNTLLLKALARYSLIAKGVEDVMDAEAAEHAVFSFYLMSNCGFQVSINCTIIVAVPFRRCFQSRSTQSKICAIILLLSRNLYVSLVMDKINFFQLPLDLRAKMSSMPQ